MLRIFIQDVGQNFKRGEVKDYTKITWDEIAKSAKMKLDKFSRLVNDAAAKGIEIDTEPLIKRITRRSRTTANQEGSKESEGPE